MELLVKSWEYSGDAEKVISFCFHYFPWLDVLFNKVTFSDIAIWVLEEAIVGPADIANLTLGKTEEYDNAEEIKPLNNKDSITRIIGDATELFDIEILLKENKINDDDKRLVILTDNILVTKYQEEEMSDKYRIVQGLGLSNYKNCAYSLVTDKFVKFKNYVQKELEKKIKFLPKYLQDVINKVDKDAKDNGLNPYIGEIFACLHVNLERMNSEGLQTDETIKSLVEIINILEYRNQVYEHERLLKLYLVHELLHTLGSQHCGSKTCVLYNYANLDNDEIISTNPLKPNKQIGMCTYHSDEIIEKIYPEFKWEIIQSRGSSDTSENQK